MSIRERMATLMVIDHLGAAGHEDDLAAVALDRVPTSAHPREEP